MFYREEQVPHNFYFGANPISRGIDLCTPEVYGQVRCTEVHGRGHTSLVGDSRFHNTSKCMHGMNQTATE